MWFRFVALIVLAYLVGAVTPAYLAAKIARGIDLREFGTRNTGVSNLYQATGKNKAILLPVLLFDLAKPWPLLWAANALGLGYPGQAAVAVAVVVGHNWPVYLRFHGGRGMLSTLGIALAIPVVNLLAPWPLGVALTIAALGAFVARNAPLGVFLAVASLPLTNWLFGDPVALTLGYLGMVAAMVVRRLAVPRREISASLGLPGILLNRLLFDRDIRDRKAWLDQEPAPVPSIRREKG